jgi:hypothetical protein
MSKIATKTTESVQSKVEPINLDLGQIMSQHNGNKSSVMRYLSSQNYSRSQIAKFMSVRYQYVRNVLTKPAKKGS